MYLSAHPYKRSQPLIKDPDRLCTICGQPYRAVSPLQKTCSKECRLSKNKNHQIRFKFDNPESSKIYNSNRLKKNPNYWREKNREEREEIISLLGGKCIVPQCSITNPLHLHIDYAPTMIGTGYRHPRHKAWIIKNLHDFRLLCANHHYELSITGKIEDTDIVQKNRNERMVA